MLVGRLGDEIPAFAGMTGEDAGGGGILVLKYPMAPCGLLAGAGL